MKTIFIISLIIILAIIFVPEEIMRNFLNNIENYFKELISNFFKNIWEKFKNFIFTQIEVIKESIIERVLNSIKNPFSP